MHGKKNIRASTLDAVSDLQKSLYVFVVKVRAECQASISKFTSSAPANSSHLCLLGRRAFGNFNLALFTSSFTIIQSRNMQYKSWIFMRKNAQYWQRKITFCTFQSKKGQTMILTSKAEIEIVLTCRYGQWP